jgi:hypothetical protein
MNKTVLIGLSAAAVVGGLIAYRHLVPPSFKVVEYTPSKHEGEFLFGKARNPFGPNSGGTVGGRAGWSLEHKPLADGKVEFNLFKKGSFVKQLAIK